MKSPIALPTEPAYIAEVVIFELKASLNKITEKSLNEQHANSNIGISKAPSGDEETQPSSAAERKYGGIRWVIIVIALFSTNFLFALDNTIVADIQPSIIARFGQTSKFPWISVGFPLASCVTSLLWGRFFSLFEVQRLYIASIIIFQVGSALCGAAPSMNVLIIGRVLGGLGAQGMYLGAMTLIAALATPRKLPIYLSIGGGVWGLGTILGPVVGAGFAESSATWRWAFYINLCIGALFAPVYIWLLPAIRLISGQSFKKRIATIDFTGAGLLITALSLLVIAINFGGVLYDWSSAFIIVFLVISVVLFLTLGVQQKFAWFTSPNHRFVPLHLFNPEICSLCMQTAGGTMSLVIPIYFIPLHLGFARGVQPLDTAVYLLPFIFLSLLGLFISGAAVSKTGRYLPWFIVGTALQVLGAGLMYSITFSTSIPKIYGYSMIIGFGCGLSLQLPFSIIQAKVDEKTIALATGVMSQSQIMGAALALALSNAIFLNTAIADLSKILPGASHDEVLSLITGTVGGGLQKLPVETQGRVLAAIVDSIRNVYLVVLAFAGLNILGCGLLKRDRLYGTL